MRRVALCFECRMCSMTITRTIVRILQNAATFHAISRLSLEISNSKFVHVINAKCVC